jgi:hypothetical protein
MGKLIDLTGRTFERLTVIRRAAPKQNTKAVYWDCECRCGNTITVVSADLRSGHTKSCGCYNSDVITARNIAGTKHGYGTHPLYNVWKNMKERCYNPETHNYNRYGGRGITVCDEWRNNLTAFVQWSEANGYRRGLEIDRIDGSKGYSPENCRWITRKANQNNKDNNITITIDGMTRTQAEWADIAGISQGAIYQHKRRFGWDSCTEYIKKHLGT